jgi:predicted nucleotidyltransferase
LPLTAEQQDLLDAIHRVLAGDAEIEAAWLGGSLGRGAGDAFSDVDVVALVGRGPAAEVGLRYVRDVASIAEPVLVNPLYSGRVLNVVTREWRRFDISFVEPGELGRFDAAHLVPLFNKGDRTPPRKVAEPYQAKPATVLDLVNEFLRVLGLSVVAMGREEYVLGLRGVDILRQLTVDLMLEENGVGPIERGGALRRNPMLTLDQRHALQSLPPVAANRESILAINVELAAIFLPRARRLAERIGMAWPSAFEAATRRHLWERLGLSIDPAPAKGH